MPRMPFELLVLIAVLVFLLFLCWVIFFYHILSKYDEVTEIRVKELVLIFLTLLGTGIISGVVVHKRKIAVYASYIFYRILYQTFRNVFGAGLLTGFMTTAKLGYLYYLFVVPRLFFDNFEDNFFLEQQQTKKATLASFVIGQLVMFASVYHRGLYRRFAQPRCVFLLFVSFFVLQLFLTYETIIKNWDYLIKRKENRTKLLKHIVMIQLQFISNFFLQLILLPSNSYFEPDSIVRRFATGYLSNREKRACFVRSCFVGWLIAHVIFLIVYRKIFQLIVIISIWLQDWFKKNFLDKWK